MVILRINIPPQGNTAFNTFPWINKSLLFKFRRTRSSPWIRNVVAEEKIIITYLKKITYLFILQSSLLLPVQFCFISVLQIVWTVSFVNFVATVYFCGQLLHKIHYSGTRKLLFSCVRRFDHKMTCFKTRPQLSELCQNCQNDVFVRFISHTPVCIQTEIIKSNNFFTLVRNNRLYIVNIQYHRYLQSCPLIFVFL